jgi:hypothetical protein
MIFISYTRHDREIARRCEEYIKAIGFEVWVDYNNLLLENSFYEQIQNAIYRFSMALFLISTHSKHSDWIHLEMKLVELFNKPFIELSIENPNKPLNSAFPKLRRFAMQLREPG